MNQSLTDESTSEIKSLSILTDKFVYLDLSSSYKSLGNVKECLNLIGAKLADCLSKDVDYVITNHRETNRLSLTQNNVINRTQSIMIKATKQTHTATDILSTAKRLGITVLHINKLESLFERKLNYNFKKTSQLNKKEENENSYSSNKHKTTKLKNPFLKFESICKQYKPIYQEFTEWHELNFDLFTSKCTISPFQIYFSDDIKADESTRRDQEEMHSSSSKSLNESSTQANKSMNQQSQSKQSQKQLKPTAAGGDTSLTVKKKAIGYCECCKKKFDNLKQHLTSMQHETFERNLSNFKELDDYVKGSLSFDNLLMKIFNDKQENTENYNPEKKEGDLIEEKTVGIINEGIQEDYEPVVKKQDTRNSSEKQNYEKILKILKDDELENPLDSKNEEKSTYIDSEAIHTLNDVLDSNPKSPENDNNISPQTSQVSARSDEKLKSIQIINELLTKEDVLDKDETLSDADESESTIDEDDDESGIDQSALFENVSVQDEYLIQKEKENNFNHHHHHKTQSCSKLPDANVEIISNHLSLTNTYTLPNTYIKYIDNEIEYEMDEEDNVWLDLVNQKLINDNLIKNEITSEQFETLMDCFEKEAYLQISLKEQEQNNRTIDDEQEDICSICMDDECVNTNAILFCDRCNLTVHQECYGVPFIPEGVWLCKKCLHSPDKEIDCILCPNNYGAFKQTDNDKWSHVICAIWIPEVHFSDTLYLEPIVGIEKIPKSRWSLVCYLCKKRNKGACIQCSHKKCCTAFHVTCAQKAGIYMNVESIETNQRKKNGKRRRNSSSSSTISINALSNQDDSMTSTTSSLVDVVRVAYCDKHVPPETLQSYDTKASKSQIEALLKKEHEIRLEKVNKLMQERKIVPKNVIVPNLSNELCNNLSKRYLNTENKNIFFSKLLNYWLLKRATRNGQPLLRSLQQKSIINNNRKKSTQNNNNNYFKFDSLELEEKYLACKKLRQNLEKQRLLMELVQKRERIKYECIAIDQLKTVYEINSFNGIFLQRLLYILKDLDKKKIFHEPVNLTQVPTYLDVIKQPMDFKTMQNKINEIKYETLSQFESDFDLIINNCLDFNPLKISIYNKAALKLREQAAVYMKQAKQIYEQFNKNIEKEQIPTIEYEIKSDKENEINSITNYFDLIKSSNENQQKLETINTNTSTITTNNNNNNTKRKKVLGENLSFINTY